MDVLEKGVLVTPNFLGSFAHLVISTDAGIHSKAFHENAVKELGRRDSGIVIHTSMSRAKHIVGASCIVTSFWRCCDRMRAMFSHSHSAAVASSWIHVTDHSVKVV